MELELKIYNCLCATARFTINSINADDSDFGYSYDSDPENAEDYGCGNRIFEPKPSTDEILTKYSISNDEYDEICKKLQERLSFGRCGYCG